MNATMQYPCTNKRKQCFRAYVTYWDILVILRGKAEVGSVSALHYDVEFYVHTRAS